MHRVVRNWILLGIILAIVALAISQWSRSPGRWTLARVREVVDHSTPSGSSRKQVEAFLASDPFHLEKMQETSPYDPKTRTLHSLLRHTETGLLHVTDIALTFHFGPSGKLARVEAHEEHPGL